MSYPTRCLCGRKIGSRNTCGPREPRSLRTEAFAEEKVDTRNSRDRILPDRSPHLLSQRADRVDIQDQRQFPPRLLGMFALEFA